VTVNELFVQAIGAGLTVALDGDRIVVRPKGQISDELRATFVAQRGDVLAALQARKSTPATQASVSPRPCIDCEELHAGVFCLHYQSTMPAPARAVRCVRFVQKQPAVPW
jgi:hypothetical protein